MRKNTFVTAFCFGLLSALALFPVLVLAEGENRPPTHREKVLSGDIQLESTELKKEDPYFVSQDFVIKYFKDLEGLINKLAKGSMQRPGPLGINELNYLTGVYLYCNVKLGACPAVLETILELDVINAKLNKNTDCPQMLAFWKYWVKNDMESRQKYMIKTSLSNAFTDFNARQRPKFIKCQDTLAAILQDAGSDAEFFKNRYQAGNKTLTSLGKMLLLLDHIKEKVPNVFKITGVE